MVCGLWFVVYGAPTRVTWHPAYTEMVSPEILACPVLLTINGVSGVNGRIRVMALVAGSPRCGDVAAAYLIDII